MSPNVPSPKKMLLALALASGAGVNAAAEKAGVCRKTVQRCLKRPAFRKLVADLRGQLVATALGRMADNMTAAADARLMGEAGRETRFGYSYNAVNRGAREHGPFVAWRYDRVDLRGAFLRTNASGLTVSRIRSGIALHYASYVVGVAREEGTTGLGPLYQFTLSSLLR